MPRATAWASSLIASVPLKLFHPPARGGVRNMRRQLCQVPESSNLKPIYGTTAPGLFEFGRAMAPRRETVRRRHEQYGDICFTTVFGRRCVLPATPATAEAAIVNRDGVFANGPGWGFLVGVAFRRGLMLMDFAEHRTHRRVFGQLFTPTNLRSHMLGLQPVISDRIAGLSTGEVFLADEIRSIVLDASLRAFVGVDLSRSEAEFVNGAFAETVAAIDAAIRVPLPGTTWRRSVRARRGLEKFFRDRIADKRASETADLFSVLCRHEFDNGERLDDTQIVDHMIFLLFAAYDTTTIGLSSMVHFMAEYPQWQQLARAVSTRLPAQLTYDMLGELTTLDSIFKESLRMHSPVQVLARKALRDTDLGGYFVPRGTLVLVEPDAIHSNPAVWSDPRRFDPERFSRERAEDKAHRFSWIPFGAGPHMCIGVLFAQMEMKILMHQLLRSYRWATPAAPPAGCERNLLGDPVEQLPVRLTAL